MPITLTEQDYIDAAARLKCDVPAIKAVREIESGGSGFLKSGRVKILFEGHVFSRLTKGIYNKSHPTISYPKWTTKFYKGGEGEWSRLDEAMALDASAALKSASWGLFQIMGLNYQLAGHSSVEAFVEAMKTGERAQFMAFLDYVKSTHLDDELQRHDWATFARGYNGALYWKNQYDKKLAAAFRKFGGK